jgi:sec-independent protein translocase protein TatC
MSTATTQDRHEPEEEEERGEPPGDRAQPLLSHLIELRRRLLYSAVGFIVLFFACYAVAEDIFGFLVIPLLEKEPNTALVYTALHEAFFTYVKVAFFGAACIGFPLFAAQIWLFVAPGLYREEKAAFLPFLIATPVMFAIGAAFVYFLVVPVAWDFFLSFQRLGGGPGAVKIEVLPKVNEYLSLVMRLIFAFGLAFEMPVGLVLLARIGIVSADGLRKKRRYAIVAAFVAAAVLTPPDVISQVGLAAPIILLYEVSILLAQLIERRRERKRDAEDTA